MDFEKEMTRVARAMEEFESALNDLGYALVEKGVLKEGLTFTSGVVDCGVTDSDGFWYEIEYAEDLTNEYGIVDIPKEANNAYGNWAKEV